MSDKISGEPQVGSPLPCSASCPKCGSEDISRHHRERTERWDKSIGDRSTRSNEFVTVRKFETVCDKECITHHCRTCQYGWETDVLPNVRPVESMGLLSLIDHWENEAVEYDEIAATSNKAGRLTSCSLHRGRAEMMRQAAIDLKSAINEDNDPRDLRGKGD